jgi:hypothetical protein
LEHWHSFVVFESGVPVALTGGEEASFLDDIVAGSGALDADETPEATATDA